jgi:hypothetical protein
VHFEPTGQLGAIKTEPSVTESIGRPLRPEVGIAIG